MQCEYSFGRFLTNCIVIGELLSDKLNSDEKKIMLCIDTKTNPKSVNIFSPDNENYVKSKSTVEILDELAILVQEYYRGLSILPDTGV